MTDLMTSRRRVLALLGSPALSAALPLALPLPAHAANETLKVLYRKESIDALVRLDPTVESATAALESEFNDQGFRIVQPNAETYKALDQGPGVAVTFAANAGYSMLFSLSRNVRPRPGSDTGIAEVNLTGRVFVGHTIVATKRGRGQQLVNLASDTREFAERSALEAAARKAAAQLAETTSEALKAIAPEKLAELSQLGPIKDIYEPIPVPQGVAPPLPTAAPSPPPPVPLRPPQPSSDTPFAVAPVPDPLRPPTAPAPLPATTNPLDASGPLPPPARRFALVVCLSDYSSTRARMSPAKGPGDLPGVAIDRQTLTQGLRSIGFKDEDVIVLADAQATSGAVRGALGKLVASTGPDDLVLIAISAHGAPKTGPAGFGSPVLADFSWTDPNGLDFWELQSKVGNMRARRTVMFLDTCHSGGATELMQTAMIDAGGVSLQTQNGSQNAAAIASAVSSGRHFAVVTASRTEEISLEQPPGGGLFTKRLMAALTATKGQEPLLTVFRQQVERQVADESRSICSRGTSCKQQTPQFAFSGRGDMIRF